MNKTIMEGLIVYQPEISYMTDERMIAIAKTYIAVDDGQQRDVFSVMCFGKTAEELCRKYSPGQRIIASGSIHNNNFRDANGTRHYQCYFLVNEILEEEPTPGRLNDVVEGEKSYLPLMIEDVIYLRLKGGKFDD